MLSFFNKKQENKQVSSIKTEEVAYIIEACQRASEGDFESRITGINPESQLGSLARNINYLVDVCDAYVRESAAAMESCSQDRFHRPILLRGMHGGFKKAAVTINTAGQKMRSSNENLEYVAKLANENAESVSSVAAACEELSATSGEISKQTEDSNKLTLQAVSVVKKAEAQVQNLNEAAASISDVVALISQITRQTNLLALNATIEAARAGEAGVSFAVVATEVKNLSNSIADATKKINKQVEEMQLTVKGVVDMIQTVNGTVQQISGSAQTVSTSVAEQVIATTDIAKSLSNISANSSLVSERIVKKKD